MYRPTASLISYDEATEISYIENLEQVIQERSLGQVFVAKYSICQPHWVA